MWEKLTHGCRSEYIAHIFSILYHLAQELPVVALTKPTADGTSSFRHYIICFYFLSSVTARQPIRIIKTTFKQFAAEFLIFLAWSLFPMHRCGMSTRERGPDSISLLLFIWGENLGIGSQVGDGAIAQFIHSSVSYTDKYV